MNNYIISIKALDRISYFAGLSDEHPTTIPVLVWSGKTFQTQRVDMEAIIFTEQKENAHILIGSINLKSYLYRILEQLPYFSIEIDEIRIELVPSPE